MDDGDLPMELGETLAGLDAQGALINGEKLGRKYTIPASRFSGNVRGQKDRYTGRTIVAMLMRNESGFTMYGKRFAKISNAAGYGAVEAVDGYCAVTADKNLGLIDPFLSANGVLDDEIFWLLLEGTVPCLTPFEAGGFNKTIAAGDPLIGATGSTTGTSGVGRVCVGGVLAGGSLGATEAYAHARNNLGRALSARTTGETNADILMDLFIRY